MASYEMESHYLTLLSDMGKYSWRDEEREEKKPQTHKKKNPICTLRIVHTMLISKLIL